MRSSREVRSWGGGVVALASAIGLLVGLRAIVAIELDGLTSLLDVETLPRETFGLPWSDVAVWPGDLQRLAWTGLLRTLAALGLASVAVAALNAVAILAESSTGRSRELAIRSAVGGAPRVIVIGLLRELRTLFVAGAGLGVVAGVGGGMALRLAWPDGGSGPLTASALDAVAALLLLALVVALAHVIGVWRALRADHTSTELRGGSRGGTDPGAVFIRNALAAVHVAVAATVLATAAGLSGRAGDEGGASGMASAGFDAAATWMVEASSPSPRTWAETLEVLRDVGTLEAESLAAPGALIGLGVRDIAIAECGDCSRGLMPAPLWSALADHHLVAPGYFGLLGLELIDGRDFTVDDVADATPVVIVNERFARTSFEDGRPLGKRIRIGTDMDGWYTVVGIVSDHSVPTLGSDGRVRETVYLSALQHPSTTVQVVLRGSESTAMKAHETLAAAGFGVAPPVTVESVRREANRAVAWSRGLVLLLATLVAGLAAHGIYVVAMQTTRRRAPDLAVRRAVGAPSWRIVSFVLGERLRVTTWGLAGYLFFGTLASAFVQATTGLSGPPVAGWIVIGSALASVALIASLRAAQQALLVDPRRLLD